MMQDYNEYLNDNAEILKFIRDYSLTEKINCADMEAKSRASIEGKQFLHSYRYSFIYDAIREKKIDSIRVGSKAIEIVNLLENPYSKDIEELVCDSYANDNSMEIN